ncbi:hypothetical protein [Allosphingosinicella vermicomposti]|uniref:hypothetical protein n=1 Tax=Allosphingosinicella vermicomposti TaxID=614671 RepID=UPI000D0F3D57|nr:hypothetical protein [Allosphingosinicella vermicomposti]
MTQRRTPSRRPLPATHIRVPAFAPVPLRYRADGWTPGRQADFLGKLAETRSVAAAARHVGMTRESAYRLREKEGAGSFAAAWDAIMPRLAALQLAGPRKVTPSPNFHRAFYGTLKPIMRGGKHVATLHSTSNDAALQLYRQDMAIRRLHRRRAERSQVK